jgi:hypothetical protein
MGRGLSLSVFGIDRDSRGGLADGESPFRRLLKGVPKGGDMGILWRKGHFRVFKHGELIDVGGEMVNPRQFSQSIYLSIFMG